MRGEDNASVVPVPERENTDGRTIGSCASSLETKTGTKNALKDEGIYCIVSTALLILLSIVGCDLKIGRLLYATGLRALVHVSG